MKRAAYLTPGEFELMEVLWPLREASVRQVWETVNPRRAVAYTTVMTVLYKMHRKGVLSQRKQGKAYLYSPTIDRERALEGVVEYILKTYFKGSPQELLRFIHKEEQTSDAGDPRHSPSTHTESVTTSSIDEVLL